MSTADQLPVIVGVGQINDRPSDPLAGIDPVALMAQSLRRAEIDAGVPLLAEADRLSIVRQISFPRIDDAGQHVARAIGSSRAIVTQTELPSGESPVRLLNDAANRIGAGEIEVALVCGGEALRTAAAQVAAKEGGRRLDPVREAPHRSRTGYAAEHGLVAPVDIYPLYENAMRAALDQSLAEGQAESAAIWALMSRVAAANPHAWLCEPVEAEAIVSPGPANRPIAFPYTKLQVANSAVNQGAAFIVTSVASARRQRISEHKWVYVGNGAAANEPDDILARDGYDRSASMEVSLRKALELNRITPADLDAVELYSCFPCIPKLARRVIGWPLEKPVTVFGGLTFGGGPVGNYMSHAVACMTERLRQEGGNGLLFGNGGVATRNHTIVLSSRPIPAASFPRDYDFQAKADAVRGLIPPLAPDHTGAANIETWTWFSHRDGSHASGVVIARTPTGRRTLARLTPGLVSRLAEPAASERELVGAPGGIIVQDSLRIWEFA